MPTDGRRLLLNAGLSIALTGIVVSALVIWFFAGLTFFGEPLHRVDYLHMALGFGLAAVLLVAAVPALTALRPATFMVPLGVLLATACGFAGVLSLLEMGDAARGPSGEPWWWAPQLFFALPTTWPVVILVAATPWLRARSRRVRPARPDRSSAPGRPRST